MKTFQELVQEGVAGIKHNKIPKIPNSGKAVEKKILKADPWHHGEELSVAIGKAWPKI